MSEIKRALVVGLGAIGAIWAVRMQERDPGCVQVLVDPGRLARYKAQGIVFNGKRFDFHYVLPEPGHEPADLILIATKIDGLQAAIEGIRPFVGDQTLILSLLNGVSSEEQVVSVYGWEHVLYAHIVGHGSTRVGNAIQFDGVGRIVFGEAENQTHSERVARVARFFDRTGVTYEIPEDMRFAQWCKFVLNVGVNQVSAVLRADYGVFQRVPAVLALATDLMDEALAIAEKVGVQHIDRILPWCLDFIRNTPPAFKSSMLQDIEGGKQTEVALFGETVCQLGATYAIPTPHNATFVKLIHSLEAMA